MRWILPLLVSASTVWAQFPLPIPARPTNFPLKHSRNAGGVVVAWGANDAGQARVPAGLANVLQVVGGYDHSLALKSDGTVVGWGRNGAGQISVPSGLNGVVQLAAGSNYSLALKSNGTGVQWGWNSALQASAPPELAAVVGGAAGPYYCLALKKDGTVVAWGENDAGQASVPAGLAGVVQVAAGYHHSLALKSDGTVVAWGANNAGQASVPAGLADVVQVAAGYHHSLALKSNGTVVAWGNAGQASVPAGLAGVVQVAAGYFHSLALKSDGTVVAWGANDAGQASVPAGLADVVQVAAGERHSLALKSGDTDVDGLSDFSEINVHGTDAKRADTDGDGLGDGAEVNVHGTDPRKADDSDKDGVGDFLEVNVHGTDPKNPDTDADAYSDGFEIFSIKSNPLGPNDAPTFVRVGDPKNPDEDSGGYDVENAGIGYVGEEYEVGITEVTNLMYARFLNAVAKEDFLYGLYTTLMGTDGSGGIVRNGSSGNYTYAVKPGFENRPVNFVSLYDTLRYINWLHNGMPSKSVQDSSTTENGAYKLLGANPRNVIRNAGAKFFLPDQDEWHKAAFFDPNPGQGRPTDSYWPLADQSTTGPGGNFGPSRINVVGTSAGPSHYGTFDQGGNVWEWTETVLNDGQRLLAGGGRPMSPGLTTRETSDLGFRVGRTVATATGKALVTPALVRVGEEFNLGDDTNRRLGAVPYEFNMGTYEVSNAEYAAFLNAVAKTDTFYGLYNTRMGTDPQGGIMRSGQNGNFSYNVKAGFANRPVNFVTIYSAMRFCNWLHNGARPESDMERGAYRLLGNIPSNTVAIRRNPSARFYLPTEDEWYKAAFYDPSPAGMPTASYWSYAVKADLAKAQQINFNGAYAGATDVSLPGVASFFGTFGQSGNVAEWTETLSSSKSERLVWGGHYSSSAAGVSSLSATPTDPLSQTAVVGFRIAADLDAMLAPKPTATPALDRTPPTLRVTAPRGNSVGTTAQRFTLRGTASDNVTPTRMQIRVRAPGSKNFGGWASVNLAKGSAKAKSWTHVVAMNRRGNWVVQMRVLDGRNNASPARAITITRR